MAIVSLFFSSSEEELDVSLNENVDIGYSLQTAGEVLCAMRIVVECTVEYTYVFDTVFVNGLKPLADVFNGDVRIGFFCR